MLPQLPQKPFNQWTSKDIIDFLKQVDKQTWIKIAIVGVVLLLLFLIVIWPAWFKRVTVHQQIKSVKANIDLLETQKIREPEWIRNKADFGRYIQNVKSRLYEPGETALLLGEISKLANDSNVSIIASRPSEDKIKFPAPFDQTYQSSLYDFTVEGGYHELGDFVSKIETYPKLMKIRYFQILPRDEMPDKHLAEIRLSVISYKRGTA